MNATDTQMPSQADFALSEGMQVDTVANSRVRRALVRNPAFMGGLILLILIVLVAVFASWLFPHNPLDMVSLPLQWPGQDPAFLLGTGPLGTDLAAGMAYGARASLLVGFCAALVCFAIGTVVGATSGYFGSWVDNVLIRCTEVFQTVPPFLLVVILITITGPTLLTIIFAIGFSSWPSVARLVRAEFRSIKQMDYVLAARSLGYSTPRIMFVEILPNALPPVIVLVSVIAANAILIEASLSFLGLGDPNVLSWGTMIGDGRAFLRTEWYLTALPGAAISATVLSLNLVGDGLNEILNPRSGQV